MDPQTIFNCIQGVNCCVQGGSTPLIPPPDKYSPAVQLSSHLKEGLV